MPRVHFCDLTTRYILTGRNSTHGTKPALLSVGYGEEDVSQERNPSVLLAAGAAENRVDPRRDGQRRAVPTTLGKGAREAS